MKTEHDEILDIADELKLAAGAMTNDKRDIVFGDWLGQFDNTELKKASDQKEIEIIIEKNNILHPWEKKILIEKTRSFNRMIETITEQIMKELFKDEL